MGPHRLAVPLIAVLMAAPVQPSPATVDQPVLQAAGGTWSSALNSNLLGTAVLYAWRVELEQAEFRFTLQGPAGWNSGKSYSWRVRQQGPGVYVGKEELPGISAVAGTYTLVTEIDAKQARTRFSVTPTPQLARPPVQVAIDQQKVIRLTWGAVPNARSYEVGFTDLEGQPLLSVFSHWTNHAFVIHLAPGRYRARVAAYTFDFTQELSATLSIPAQFHGGEGTEEFVMP